MSFVHVAVVGADPERLAASVGQLGADTVDLVGPPDEQEAGRDGKGLAGRGLVEAERGTRGALTIRSTDTGELTARSLDV